MQDNIRLYPWYVALFGAMAWIPIFFLFFSQYVTLSQVLQLEAIYYVAVVLLEAPSGYFSDAVGRRPTLLIASTSMSLAYTLFLIGNGFWLFAAAQLCLAIGFAFQSGTDTSFHFDSLVALNKASEYGSKEAIAGRKSLAAGALAIFLGGVVGTVSLRLAYLLSLATAIGALLIAMRFREPYRQDSEMASQPGPLRQLVLCIGYTRHPVLAWILGFVVLMTILDHIPYEFYQPYIDLLGDWGGWLSGPTPLTAGVVMGSSTLLGAFAAGRSIWLREAIGLGSTLLLSGGIQILLIAVMAAWLHPLVVPLVLLRSIPYALSAAPLRAAIAPLVSRSQRATYFSMQSLAGRLAFAITLFGLSLSVGSTVINWPVLSAILRYSALIGITGFVILFLCRRALESGRIDAALTAGEPRRKLTRAGMPTSKHN